MTKKIRVWKLGSLEHKVAPTRKAVEQLCSALEKIGSSDKAIHNLVWGPDIQVIEIPDASSIENYVVSKVEERDNKLFMEAEKV